MTIAFAPGELKELNISMQRASLAITKLFVGTFPYDGQSAAMDGIYVHVRNTSSIDIPVHCDIYDWQAWWKKPKGQDRQWRSSATVPAGGDHDFYEEIAHTGFDETYLRVELLVADTLVLTIPRFYIVPAKIYTGNNPKGVGECTYKEPGMIVLWYSAPSLSNLWQGNYKYPPSRYGSPVYLKQFDYRARNHSFSYGWWPGVFLPFWDANLTLSQLWEAYIVGYGGGSVRFDFTPA